jgi:hypothetical protein
MDLEPAPRAAEPDDLISPRADGKVYCCDSLGWVAPDVAFDHHGVSSRSLDEDLGDRD